MSALSRAEARRAERRRFLTQTSAAAIGAFGLAQLSGTTVNAQSVTDADILNFALNLEYLEAEYYLRAAFGSGLTDVAGQGTLGDVTGGKRVKFRTKAFANYATEIALDEKAHVQFLRAALGGAAVARPAIDFTAAFTGAARAAGLIKDTETFDPFADELSFMLGAYIFEDVGVTAYKGAARLIVNKDYLEAAAGLLAVEAYHAGEIRSILYSLRLFTPTQRISDLRNTADGPQDLDQGLGDRDTANIVPTDENGLAFSRSAAQVLNIVYLGGASANYGFFPRQMNGTIR